MDAPGVARVLADGRRSVLHCGAGPDIVRQGGAPAAVLKAMSAVAAGVAAGATNDPFVQDGVNVTIEPK
jgi:hypothetical protein